MKRKITFKLLVMLVTASVLLSSTGLSAMLAEAQGVDEATSVSSSDNSAPVTTADPDVSSEGGKLKKAGPVIGVEGGQLYASAQSEITWYGTGTSGDPYQVSDAAHFLGIQALVNDTGNANKYFKLTANIDLSTVTISDFTSNPYAGFQAYLICMNPVFDVGANALKVFINLDGAIPGGGGTKYSIHGLNITNSDKDTCGIFGYLSSNSVISNISFDDCSVAVTTSLAKVSAVIAVQNMGKIDNCSFNSVSLNLNQGDGYAGSSVTFSTGHVVNVGNSIVAGDNQGKIGNCDFSNVSLVFNKRNYAGAVAGQNTGMIGTYDGTTAAPVAIEGLTVTASPGDGSTYIGGIAGKNTATLANCSVTLPDVANKNRFTYGTKVGGIAGTNTGSVANCYVYGKVLSSGSLNGLTDELTSSRYDIKGTNGIFGGITGENTGTVSYCSAVNIGTFNSANSGMSYGGITGTSSAAISNCFASGKVADSVNFSTDYYLGGIVGSAATGTLLSSCYALVSITQDASYAGALIGFGAKTAMLSSSYPNYWSSNVCGWPTQCSLLGADNYDIQRNIEALQIQSSTTAELNKTTDFTHSWGSTGCSVGISGINTTSAFSDSGSLSTETSQRLFVGASGTAGSYRKIYYNLTISLPSDGANRIGASGHLFTYSQRLYIDALTVTYSTANPVVSRSNPIILSSAGDAALMRNMPYTDFRLGADITLPVTWSVFIFSGTLDGNSKVFTISKPVFKRIYGSRDGTVTPGVDETVNQNFAAGFIHDMTLTLNGPIVSGVMGAVISGTVKNVKLSTADKVTNALNVSTTSNTGAFIDVVRGNSYIYNCFTDITVNIDGSTGIGHIAGLIGTVDAANTTIDNCGSNSDIYYTGTSTPAIASLIGGIDNNTGIVKNCYTGGFVNQIGYIAIGSKSTAHSVQNLYWSVKNTGSGIQTAVNSSNVSGTDSFYSWSFVEGGTGYVSDDMDYSYVSINLPAAVNALANSLAGDFSVTLANPANLTVHTLSVSGGKLSIPLTKTAGSTINTILTVTHNPTGLKARITIQNGLSKSGDYYLVKTAGDLLYLSQNQSAYLDQGTAFKMMLAADINMAGKTYTPIGTSAKKFRGEFIGGTKPGGGWYTISNLTITGTDYIAMFGQTQAATIGDFNLVNITCSASTSYAACIAGLASGGTFRNMSVTNALVSAAYSGSAYAGGIAGAIPSGAAATTFTGISLDTVTVKGCNSGGSPVGSYVGGVVGNIPAATVSISNITAVDLNIKGAQYVGGIVGSQSGGTTYTNTVSGISITKSAGYVGSPTISGTGYVGGVVGRSNADASTSKITGCSVTGITVTNTGATMSSTAATGGIAGFYSGIIGDDPATTGVTEKCLVTDCTVKGALAGGIIGRSDTVSNNTKAVTVKNCTVGGATSIVALTATGSYTVGGIFGDFASAAACNIISCVVQSGVSITDGNRQGGIIANQSSLSGTLNITNCQNFAVMVTGVSSSWAGGIVCVETGSINNIKIANCVAGGSITCGTYAGGIVGYHNSLTAFSSGTNYIANCYVTAIVTAGTMGKIWGYCATAGDNTSALTDNTIADDHPNPGVKGAIANVAFSSYPQDIPAFGHSVTNNLGNAKYTFEDINKPSDVSPAQYQSSAAPITIDGNNFTPPLPPIATFNIDNVPSGAFACQGWESANTGRILITNITGSTVTVQAVRSVSTGIVAEYVNAGVPIFADGTTQSLSLKAFIPVSISNVNNDWKGDGSAGFPYIIDDKDDLVEMKNNIQKVSGVDYFGGYYRIDKDIGFDTNDFLPGGEYYNSGFCFTPLIGTDPDDASKLPFSGHLDGNGYTISGLVINNTDVISPDYTGDTGLFKQADGAVFNDIRISGAAIRGDSYASQYGGILVAKAVNTTFNAINIADSTLNNISQYAGGVVGYASASTVSISIVSGSKISTELNLDSGAGGIAGAFSGTIGSEPAVGIDYDITVEETTVSSSNAGGIVGFVNMANADMALLNIRYADVSGGLIKTDFAVAGFETYAAGGLLGSAQWPNNETVTNEVSVTNSTVSKNTTVTAKYTAGGIVGSMVINKADPEDPVAITADNLLAIDHSGSYAAVSATASSAGVSDAGGIAGYVADARFVTIANGVAGGSAGGNRYVGGVIAFIDGDNPVVSKVESLVSNFVVSASISTSTYGAKTGLVLGNASIFVFPVGPTYTAAPFSNIKYSGFQYYKKDTAPYISGYMFGGSAIDESQTTNFTETILDLNKGYYASDPWTETYKGLRYVATEGVSEGNTVVLGKVSEIQLADTNILFPLLPSFGFGSNVDNTFDNFTDTEGLNFTLANISAYDSKSVSLVNYDPVEKILSKASGADGSGDLVFQYTNGLKLALKVVAYDDLGGSGTAEDPYQISAIKHLELVRLFPSGHFVQVQDLTFTAADFASGGAYNNGGLLWEPLAGKGGAVLFTGTYDGFYEGVVHTVSGLQIARPSSATPVGFFNTIAAGGKVSNLIIQNAAVVGNKLVGALAGNVIGTGLEPAVAGVTVRNSSVSSPSTTGTANSYENPMGSVCVGGLAGSEISGMDVPVVANITGCRVESTTVSTSSTVSNPLFTNYNLYAGGIAATFQSIEDCAADNVTVNGFLYASGIAARASIVDVPDPYAISIKNCSVTGASKITATGSTSSAIAGGILAYMGKIIHTAIDNCSVAAEASVKSNTGSAGGVLGSVNGSNTDNSSLSVTIEGSESYATVTAVNDAGGILGSIRGSNIPLANILISGCVGGGEVKATHATSGATGGIIGNVTGTGFITTTVPFIVDCVESAQITNSGTNKGKLVGNCAALTAIAEANYPVVFANNYYSSYPQSTVAVKPFGSSTMSSSQTLINCLFDVMYCKQADNSFASTFSVSYTGEGVTEEVFNQIAIAHLSQETPTSYFKSQLLFWDGAAPVDLAALPSGFRIGSSDNYFTANAGSVAATTSAGVTSTLVGAGSSRTLNFTVTPTSKQAGYIEVNLGYGLKVSVPLVTFDIRGNGFAATPFELENAEQLTLLYYLPAVYYKQTADIAITLTDYAVGGVLYRQDYEKGFMPVGTAAKPFTGSFDGQGHTISGIYSVNRNLNYVGFFGYVSGAAVLKNIHIELVDNGYTSTPDAQYQSRYGIIGNKYVGGLAGYCGTSTTVENCSVAKGVVAGQQYVGGLIGMCSSNVSKCFTSCDVLAAGNTDPNPYIAFNGEAGGLIGRFFSSSNVALVISSSFSASNVYSGNKQAGGLVGCVNSTAAALNVTNCFFTGAVRSANTTQQYLLIGAGDYNQGTVNGTNLYVAGTNTSFTAARNPFTGQLGTKNYIYFDNSVLGLAGTSQGTAQTTAQLTSGTLPAGFSSADWTAAAGSYPRLIMKDSNGAVDNYSTAFCGLAVMPLTLDSKEITEDPVTHAITEDLSDGIIYPVKFADTVDGAAVTLASSKLDAGDTVAYPAGCDPTLTGNGTDRATDLLFGPSSGGTKTVYRNILSASVYPDAGHLSDFIADKGKLWYDCRSPIVTLTVTVDGEQAFRTIRLPMETADNTYHIATERQLRAIGNSYEAGSGTKFRPLYLSVCDSGINQYNYNTKLILTADINLRGDTGAVFEPIPNLYGSFNGNGFTVSNLKISKTANDSTADNIGLFKTLTGSGTYPVSVKNLNLKDVWVTGRYTVGALAGSVNQFSTIEKCTVVPSRLPGVTQSLVSGTEIVGGLAGSVAGTVTNESKSDVNVSGNNAVGGLAGTTSGTISNSFATGDVSGTITTVSATVTAFGIGGLAGTVTGGSISTAFASGNVNVTSVVTNNAANTIGIGGFAGSLGTVGSIQYCFSSGDTKAANIGNIKRTTAGGNLIFGIGGLVGVNKSTLLNCYSSSAVDAKFTGEVSGTTGSTVAAGVGGVVGTALFAVSYCYSSGLVKRETLPNIPDDVANITYFKNAIGGVIGTCNGLAPTNFSQLYFDLWNNSIVGLKAIGNLPDTSNVKSMTTDQLCSAAPQILNTNYWSFNSGVYPCLQALVLSTVSPYIRYASVLSVVALNPDIRDTSARAGSGLTMAITTRNDITILSTTYNLTWEPSADSDVKFMQYADNSGASKFVPVRTGNASQKLSLNVWVTGYQSYAEKSFAKTCAPMCGTQAQPYLIANKSDLKHIGLTAAQIRDDVKPFFTNFYDTWYTPVTIDDSSGQCTPLEDGQGNKGGKVYFRLLSDIDMTRDVDIVYNSGLGKYDVAVHDPNPATPADDNHYVPNILNEIYDVGNPLHPDGIPFQGISVDGIDYTIDNFTSSKPFIEGISAVSDINNISFTNLNINTVGTADENAGTALVRNNLGTIDGCMILSGSVTGGNNVAGIVANNYANVTNVVVSGSVTGTANAGGVVANNLKGTINGVDYTGQVSKCAFTGTVTSLQSAAAAAYAGGIAGTNGANIGNCFTLGTVSATAGATTIGGAVGINGQYGSISACYSRANVSGTAVGSDNIGGFAGANLGMITNAFCAGRVSLPAAFTQTGIFCGTNTGTLTDAFADKAMAGTSSYNLYKNCAITDKLLSMACFSSGGTASSVFTKQTAQTAYPQLTAILALDDAYAQGAYVPQKYQLLLGYSALSAATVNTRYSQYANTVSLSSTNPVSTIPGTTWASPPDYTFAGFTAVAWATSNASAMTSAGTAGSSAGSATLTASTVITTSNSKSFSISIPISVTIGAQNPNFPAGIGSSTDKYQINSAASFSSLAYYGADPELYFKLTGDVNYNGGCPTVPIAEFAGSLDGQKFTVSNVTVNNNAGLFGLIIKETGAPAGSGTVTNLGLVNAKNTSSALTYAGLLAGQINNAAVSNCFAVGEISLDAAYVGGLVGYAAPNSTITDCLTSGKFITTAAAGAVGGIAGCADMASVTGCFSSAYVKGAGGKIGGIIGRLVNSSTASGDVFSGMAVDTAIANGAAAIAAGTSAGNIAGSKESSTVTGCSYDRQISMIADANAAAKYTSELLTSGSYTVSSNLSGGSSLFAAGVAFAAMPVRFRLGSAAGSMMNFSSISAPLSVSGNVVTLAETARPGNQDSFNTGTPGLVTMNPSIDLSYVFSGLKVQTAISGVTDPLVRYFEPRLARIVTVTYTLDGNSSLNGKMAAVQIKTKHIFAGDPVTYSADAFKAVGLVPVQYEDMEDLVVSSGGIYAGGVLPDGYAYQITAKDQNDADLAVTTIDGEYGAYVGLTETTTEIKLSYTIIPSAPWGVHKFWDSLADSLIHS